MRENEGDHVPRLYQIFYGEVANIQSYGAFIKIPGCRRQGLLHVSQMSNGRVDDPYDMVARGERVYCKVIGLENDGEKIALSMKVVHQSTGRDLDPNNIQSSRDEKNRRQWNNRGPRRIELGAELNTTCRRCGGRGHLAMDCYVTRDSQYSLVPDAETLSDQEAHDERSHRKHKKKEKKEKRKQKTKKHRSSSSDSEASKDSSSDRAQKRRTRKAGARAGRDGKGRQFSESDSSSEREKSGRRENRKGGKDIGGEKFGKVNRQEKSGRRRVEQSESDSESGLVRGSHKYLETHSPEMSYSDNRARQQSGSRYRKEQEVNTREKGNKRHKASESYSGSDSDDHHKHLAMQNQNFWHSDDRVEQQSRSRERTREMMHIPEKSNRRRKDDESDTDESGLDSKSSGRKSQAMEGQDFKYSESRAWQQSGSRDKRESGSRDRKDSGSRDRKESGRGREKFSERTKASVTERELDNKQKAKYPEATARKRYKSESSSEEEGEVLSDKRRKLSADRSDSRKDREEKNWKSGSVTDNRKPSVSATRDDGRYHRVTS